MRRLPFLSCLALALAALVGCKSSTTPLAERGEPAAAPVPAANDNPRELGWVHWLRDYDAAVAQSQATGKPIFLLFQEVPGCSTCVGFGETVLSHPLVIEAIEDAFVPLAIHNNKGGHDGKILKRFGEPSWNNPVVRFVDAKGNDLIPRAANLWNTHAIAERMATALGASGREVPTYLKWAIAETAPAERATFGMYCYWSGEACLGSIPGVVATRAGHLRGREVVEVEFDGAQLTESKLRALAKSKGCGDFMATQKSARDASHGDQKYHLKRSKLRLLPLTPLQASRVNAALRHRQDPQAWLSPRQRTLYAAIQRAEDNALSDLRAPEEPRLLASYEAQLRARLQGL
jgi:hypothetical protein